MTNPQYTPTEKENFCKGVKNLMYNFMIFALRSKDESSEFYIKEISAQNAPERMCREIASIAGEIYTELWCMGISERKLRARYKLIIKKSLSVYRSQITINKSIRELSK